MTEANTIQTNVMVEPKPIVIAEIGCNHKGEMSIAKKLIDTAASFCQVDVVKFQKRDNRTLLSDTEYSTPHPNPTNSYGDTYGNHREFLEFSYDQHLELIEYCKERDIVYSTSVWDLPSAAEMSKLDPPLLKIPSAINTNFPVIDYLAAEYSGEIHVSLGMTLKKEETQLIEILANRDRLKDTVIYHCTSGYPVDEEELYLLELPKLVAEYGRDVKAIGFSGHHKGIAPDVAALTLGATYFERHFTLDRTWKGTDHAASLEPDGMRRLARDLRCVSLALQVKSREISEIEIEQRNKLKKYVDL